MLQERIYPTTFDTSKKINRIMIIGCGGSGKTTFSKKLHSILNLPLVHLDKEYWQPYWTKPTIEFWENSVENLASKELWILEGNYGGTFDIRLKRVDLVIWLDMPMPLCLYRVMKRSIQNHGKVRPDLPEGCKDKISFEFLHYIFSFPWSGRKRIVRRLGKSPFGHQIVQLKSRKQTEDFLNNFKAS